MKLNLIMLLVVSTLWLLAKSPSWGNYLFGMIRTKKVKYCLHKQGACPLQQVTLSTRSIIRLFHLKHEWEENSKIVGNEDYKYLACYLIVKYTKTHECEVILPLFNSPVWVFLILYCSTNSLNFPVTLIRLINSRHLWDFFQ